MKEMQVHANRPVRILAIYPGTRWMGYAIMKNTDILESGVHTIGHGVPTKTLVAKGRRFVARLLETFRPDIFVIEKTRYPKSQRSPRVQVFGDEIMRLAKNNGMAVRSYVPETMKKTVAGSKQVTKKAMNCILVERYPWLEGKLRTDAINDWIYWQHMFNAVALGLTCYEEHTHDTMRNHVPHTL